MSRKKLGEILVNAGLVTDLQIQRALLEQKHTGASLGQTLVREGMITEAVLARALGQQLNIPVVDLTGVRVSEEVTQLIPAKFCQEHGVIPFQLEGKFLDVAMSNPMNVGIIDDLRIRTRLNVRPYVSTKTEIFETISLSYNIGLQPISRVAYVPRSTSESIYDFSGTSKPSSQQRRDSNLGRSNMALGKVNTNDNKSELQALRLRLTTLEALVNRDEKVIKSLMMLLVTKGIASRDEVLAAIKV